MLVRLGARSIQLFEICMNEALNFRPFRIAITGGTGFIGSAIAQRLLTEGVPEVVVLSRRGQSPPWLADWMRSGRLKSVACDIRDRDSVMKALSGCDAVFHQAAVRVTRCAQEPHQAYEIMLYGTSNVLAACAVLGVKKKIAVRTKGHNCVSLWTPQLVTTRFANSQILMAEFHSAWTRKGRCHRRP